MGIWGSKAFAAFVSGFLLFTVGCSSSNSGNSGSISQDQKVFESAEKNGGTATLAWSVPYGGGTLQPGTNYFYATVSGGFPLSPASGPQIQNPAYVSLDSALTIPYLLPSRVLLSGQIWLEPANAQRRVSYNGSNVQVDLLADDGQTTLSSSLYSNFSEIKLNEFMDNLPEELNAVLPVKVWIGFNNFAANARWQDGATYIKRVGRRLNDSVFVIDCANSSTTTAASVPTPNPCATGETLDNFFPITMGTEPGHPTETDFATDGTISTVQGARMWVANQARPLDTQSTMGYRVFFEMNGKVYMGLLEKDGTPYKYVQSDGSSVDYSIVYNSQAVKSVRLALITGTVAAGLKSGSADEVNTIDLFGIGGHGINGSLAPTDLLNHYQIPAGLTGAGQIIAIIDAPGSTDVADDLNVFSQYYHLPLCNADNPCFQHIDLSSGAAVPSNNDWGNEVALDTQAVHGIAPAAKIILITAASGNAPDIVSAMTYAAGLSGVTAVSMSFSYGLSLTDQATVDQALLGAQQKLGLIFFASSGDGGFMTTPGYPAASPNVTGVGGTAINAVDWSIQTRSEVAWEFSGGGVNANAPMPAWQAALLGQMGTTVDSGYRAVPDVAAVADYQHSAFGVYFRQGWHMEGGTSLSAPIWAGLSALLAESLAHRGKSLANLVMNTAGGFNGLLYQAKAKANSAAFRDILFGSNNLSSATCALCTPGPVYNNITGIGVPAAETLFTELSGGN